MKILKKLILVIFIIALTIALVYTPENFKDTRGHWAHEYIDWAYDSKYISGYPDGTFQPDKFISKVEFYKIINNLTGLKKTRVCHFSDVSEENWFYIEVLKALAAGYISDSTEALNPNDPMSRDEASRIIAYIYGLENFESGLNFTDNDLIVNRGSVSSLVDLAILNGYPDGSFKPENPMTRGEVSKLFYSCVNTILNSNFESNIGKNTLSLISEPINFNEATSGEELARIFDYLFSVYISNKAYESPNDKDFGYKSVAITDETTLYLQSVLEDKEKFKDFLMKGSAGSYYRAINFPFNIAVTSENKFYFKGIYITPEEHVLLLEEAKKDVNFLIDSGQINSDQSQREKLYVLYSFLAEKAEYVSDKYLYSDENTNSAGVIYYSPYAIVKGGDTVCQGYSGYYILLAKELGIPVYYEEGVYTDETGKSADHAWNSVYENDEKFYIDPTGGDQDFGLYDGYFYMTEDEIREKGYRIKRL